MAQRSSTMRPPPGRQQLSREFIAQHQRARIIAALAEETVASGYRAVTVADIVRRAGIARNTFYENFSSKQDCFLATQDHALQEALRRVTDAACKVEDWEGRVDAGLGAFLGYVSSDPALAYTCIVEALSAGPASLARYEESMEYFIDLLRIGRESSTRGEQLPETLEEMIVGGLFWVIYHRIIAGETEQIEALKSQLVEFALTPYIGGEAANQALPERRAQVA